MIRKISQFLFLAFIAFSHCFLLKPFINIFKLQNSKINSNYELGNEYFKFLTDYDIISEESNNFGFKLDNPDDIIKERYDNYLIFKKNYYSIQDFNKGNNSFKLDINHFADTFELDGNNFLMKNEISAYDITKNDLVGIKQILEDPQYYIDKYRNLSSELIWDESIVSKVKNQGRCGSCWAFSTTGAIEANMRINNYSIDRLSEQELVDCSPENHGCNGGLMHLAFNYVIENDGLTSNEIYNYTAKDGKCQYTCSANNQTNTTEIIKIDGSNIRNYKFTIPRSVIDLKASLKRGPICIALDASPLEFRFYSEGVIDIPSRNNSRINHAVLLTGYSENVNGSYWIIQNSWGKNWGDKGYAKIRIKNGDGVLLSQLYGVYPYN